MEPRVQRALARGKLLALVANTGQEGGINRILLLFYFRAMLEMP